MAFCQTSVHRVLAKITIPGPPLKPVLCPTVQDKCNTATVVQNDVTTNGFIYATASLPPAPADATTAIYLERADGSKTYISGYNYDPPEIIGVSCSSGCAESTAGQQTVTIQVG